MTLRSLKDEIKAMGICPKRSLGQHFLIDRGIATKIVKLASLEPEDWVVEIGPGMGALTFLMQPLVKRLIAVELDDQLAARLREKSKGLDSLLVINEDALHIDLAKLAGQEGRKLKVVANLPYNISTPVIFHLLGFRSFVSRLTLMLQCEVAKRIVSRPGEKGYGPLAIFTQLYTEPQVVMRVPPEAFFPPPRVESAVVSFSVLCQPRVEVEDEAFFQQVVRASFAMRRKKILNALSVSPFTHATKEQIEGALCAAGIDPSRRAETLELAEFQRLVTALKRARLDRLAETLYR